MSDVIDKIIANQFKNTVEIAEQLKGDHDLTIKHGKGEVTLTKGNQDPKTFKADYVGTGLLIAYVSTLRFGEVA